MNIFVYLTETSSETLFAISCDRLYSFLSGQAPRWVKKLKPQIKGSTIICYDSPGLARKLTELGFDDFSIKDIAQGSPLKAIADAHDCKAYTPDDIKALWTAGKVLRAIETNVANLKFLEKVFKEDLKLPKSKSKKKGKPVQEETEKEVSEVESV